MKHFKRHEIEPFVETGQVAEALHREFRVYIRNYPVDPENRGGVWRSGVRVVQLVEPLGDHDMERMTPGSIYKYRIGHRQNWHYCMVGSDGSVKVWTPAVVQRWEDDDA